MVVVHQWRSTLAATVQRPSLSIQSSSQVLVTQIRMVSHGVSSWRSQGQLEVTILLILCSVSCSKVGIWRIRRGGTCRILAVYCSILDSFWDDKTDDNMHFNAVVKLAFCTSQRAGFQHAGYLCARVLQEGPNMVNSKCSLMYNNESHSPQAWMPVSLSSCRWYRWRWGDELWP